MLLVLLIVFLFPKERHYSEPPVLVINGMSYGVHENRFLDELPNGFTEAGVITEEMNSNNDNDYYIGCTYFCIVVNYGGKKNFASSIYTEQQNNNLSCRCGIGKTVMMLE